jgi:tetratricopeptide (TPR) repeat protein
MQWSGRYDRPYKDLFALQDEITRAIAGALKMKLLPDGYAAEQSDRPPGGRLDAYNAVLEGRYHSFRGTEADARKALEYFAQAIELDPRYAFALSNQSGVLVNLGAEFLEGPQAQEAYAKARVASDRALALSPNLAAAHRARGDLLETADFDLRGAEAEYRRAMDLQPSYGGGKALLARMRATLGEGDQAVELLRQAIAADPLGNYYQPLASYLSGLNRVDEAEAAIRKAIELQPTAAGFHQQLAIIEIQRGCATRVPWSVTG